MRDSSPAMFGVCTATALGLLLRCVRLVLELAEEIPARSSIVPALHMPIALARWRRFPGRADWGMGSDLVAKMLL